MITQFRVKNYKALRDVTLDLTPIHVLIGPNDTGKTSLLEAVGALCRSVDEPLTRAFTGRWEGRDLVWQGSQAQDGNVELSTSIDRGALCYTTLCTFKKRGRNVILCGEWIGAEPTDEAPTRVELKAQGHPETWVRRVDQGNPGLDEAHRELCKAIHEKLAGVRLHRWIPQLLSVPIAPFPRGRFELDPTGFGLALCLDDILGDDRMRFDQLEGRFRQIFPEVTQIKLLPEMGFLAEYSPGVSVPILRSGPGKGLHFKLSGGGVIPASQMSDGTLLVLAYLVVLKSPEQPRMLLVEEPENGIHPKRLEEVLSILRDLITEQKHTQVILTTHSPYVLDLFKPEEVTLCTKGEDGAVNTRRLSESKAVRKQIDAFTLGEIWTAEGDEALAEPADPDEEASP
jgi:energy-coupling factor transporter ATP-binding protein EcfA2